MEDGSFDAPGVTSSMGYVFGPTWSSDSVDADDGSIDGSGLNGRSFLASDTGNPTGAFTFNGYDLGRLPSHVGIVVTDAFDPVVFEAIAWDGSRRAALRRRDGQVPGHAVQQPRRVDVSRDLGAAVVLVPAAGPDAVLPGHVPQRGDLLHPRGPQPDQRALHHVGAVKGRDLAQVPDDGRMRRLAAPELIECNAHAVQRTSPCR
jgi:hypothetical protein